MDEDQLIGIYINGVDLLEPDFFICEPSIEGYLYDKTAETCIQADSSTTNIYSYASPYKLTNQEVEKRSNHWNQLLVINSKFSDLNSSSKILFFEICKNIQHQKNQEIDKTRVAWAFLIPLASDGSMNTNANLKLQLYKVRKKCKISHQDCNVYHLYSEHKRKKIFGSLQITVKGVIANKIKPPEEKENLSLRSAKEEKNYTEILTNLKPMTKTGEWSRLPSQLCKVPNKIHKSRALGKNGSSFLQFSRQGHHVAAAYLSQIIILEVESGEEVITFNSHIGFIYELDWSLDDKFLLSVSNDCRGAVWSLNQKTPLYVLPHPSYVYCGRWFGNEQIITGGKDHLVRYWCKTKIGFDLKEEISGHSGFVSALAIQDTMLLSGDSHGCIILRKFSEGSWTLMKQLTFSEIPKNVIDSIHTHSNSRRVIISVRSRGSYMIDVTSGIILQTYKSAINTLARSISCLTPCGSFLYSFCQNGDVGVWEVNTGKLFATYDNLYSIDRLSELSGCINYHPHEHMIGITALGQNYPLLLLKYDFSKLDDSVKLGLKFFDKGLERNFSVPMMMSKARANVDEGSKKENRELPELDLEQFRRKSFRT